MCANRDSKDRFLSQITLKIDFFLKSITEIRFCNLMYVSEYAYEFSSIHASGHSSILFLIWLIIYDLVDNYLVNYF